LALSIIICPVLQIALVSSETRSWKCPRQWQIVTWGTGGWWVQRAREPA